MPDSSKFCVATSIDDLAALHIDDEAAVLVGYFQNRRYVEESSQSIDWTSLEPSSSTQWTSNVQKWAKTEDPLVVHVRRGDYRNVHAFGLLGSDYYRRAIEEARRFGCGGRIWLFSDEPERATELLPKEELARSPRVMHAPTGVEPATVHFAMRHGVAYVLANSTFSWWAAAASLQTPAFVALPRPWFRHLKGFEGLAWDGWHSISA